MRIAIIAPEQIPVPPILGGSVEISIMAVARKLAKHHAVTVVSRTHRRYPAHSIVSGVSIYRVPAGTSRNYLKNVKRFLGGKRFDVIQIDNRPRFARSIKRMFPDTTVSLFLHSLTFVSRPYSDRRTAGKGLSAADIVVVNSASLQRQLTLRFPSAAEKIRKVWLGVDTARFTPASHVRKKGRAFTVLFAGRLIPRKGLPVLLKAARLVRFRTSRPLKIMIAGSAQQRAYSARMKALARKSGVRATFLGSVPHRRMHRIYRQADIFVCPSQKHEAFGLVNVEALASGVPVVASAIGGIREVVTDGRNGFLVRKYRRPRAFADAIVKLIRNRHLLRGMKIQARKDCVERFSWSATARRLSALYSSISSSSLRR